MVSCMESRIFNEIDQMNPWLKKGVGDIFNSSQYLARTQATFLLQKEWDALVTVLVGPRQAGKTTLGKYLCQEIIKKNRFTQLVYLNCDSAILRQWLTRVSIIGELQETFGVERFILFIDEVQRLENPGLLIKAIYDLQLPIKIIVSGSSQLEIKSKVQEHLTGRQIEAVILPLSYDELPTPKQLERQLIFGSYPQIVTAGLYKQLLSELYRRYINKDVIELLNIGKPAVFEKLMVLIAHGSGQLISYQTLATDCQLSGVSVKNYINLLEKTYVIKTVLPFLGNKRSEVTSNPKCYYLDNGFRNQALGDFASVESRSDKGLLVESAVFQELYKYKVQHFLNYKIYFWRTKNGAEVDFVLKQSDQNILPIEVKYQSFSQPKVTRSFRSFIQAYQPGQALVISKDYSEEIMIESTKVIFIPLFRMKKILELISSRFKEP